MPAEAFNVRSCGADCLCASRKVLEPVALPEGITPLLGPVVEVIEIEPPPRDPVLAHHEASHAAAAHALGAPVLAVRIDGMPVASIDYRTSKPAARAAIIMSGPHGERWHSRITYRPYDDAVVAHVAAVKALRLGPCDACRTILAIAREIGSAAPDAEYLRRYREIEAATIQMIQTPRVWRAVTDLAGQLMLRGQISGEDAHEIMGRHVEFGSVTI